MRIRKIHQGGEPDTVFEIFKLSPDICLADFGVIKTAFGYDFGFYFNELLQPHPIV